MNILVVDDNESDRSSGGVPAEGPVEEASYLRHYNEVLVHKLEGKLAQLQQAHRELAQDIAERERSEEALRRANAMMAAQSESSLDGILMVSPAGQILSFNRRFLEMWGIPEEAIASRSDEEALRSVLDKLADPEEFTARVQHLYAHPDESSREEVLLRDGRAFDCYSAPAAAPAGDHYGRVWHFRDVTEHRQAERDLQASETRYRRLFESAKDGILILDACTGAIVDANPFLIELLGYSHEELLGRRLWEIGKFKDVAASEDAFAELRKKGYVRYEDLPLETRHGRRVDVEFVSNVYPVGSTSVIQCNVCDITERKRAEGERVLLEAQLRQQQKLESIGTLASGVAHEINNPINGVMNYAQLILDAVDESSPVREYAGEILHETERVATIVRNLLQFSRHDKQAHSSARVQDIVEQTLSLIRTVMRRDQITLEVDVPEGLPSVECRSQQIQQVLMNLLTNARDALNEKYPGHHDDKVARVSAGVLDRDGRRWVRVTVEDYGQGIPPEVRERIFDPFFTTKPRDIGTGLGLSISLGIAKEHRGELRFETEPGEWTRFHLELPVENGRESGEEL